jgi:hypothetical protein
VVSGFASAVDLRRVGRAEDAYVLPDSVARAMLRQLSVEYSAPNCGRFGCYRIDGNSRYGDLARSVECQVFGEFFGNTPASMRTDYEPYE